MICKDCGEKDMRYDDKEKSYHCNNCGSRHLGNSIVPVFYIREGCKIYLEGQRACLNMEKKLNEVGVETRVGCNEAGMWSIYIISVPEKLIDTAINF